nr:unnamed protein product [Callosobruchus chinensis]CAH7737543.1 unnamed protein product [Callosobruchus chinensis]
MRELRVQKNTPSDSGNKNRKKYVFFEQLLFLIPTMKNIETSSNVENHETEASIDTTTHETEGTSVQTHRSRKRKVLFEEQVLGYLNSKQDKHTSNMDDEDDDKLFLLSLLRPIKALPQQTRFGLRMQMMQLVQNATQQQQQCQQYRRPEQYQTQLQHQSPHFQQSQYLQQPSGSLFPISASLLSPSNPPSVESQSSTQSEVYSVLDI